MDEIIFMALVIFLMLLTDFIRALSVFSLAAKLRWGCGIKNWVFMAILYCMGVAQKRWMSLDDYIFNN